MAVYTGAMPAGPGLVYMPVCFTGVEAMLFRYLLPYFNVVGQAAFGAACGVIASLIFGPEVLPQLLGLAIGAISGAIIGGGLTIWTLATGNCTCPPGADGLCIDLVFLRVPGVAAPVPVWPMVLPNSAACPVLVPPGCP
jgi:hypothetical protein